MNRKCSRICRLLIVALSLSVLLRAAPSAFAEGRQEQLDRKIAQIISQMPSSADTDVKKALFLHDYIVKTVTYELTGDHQTAYGALIEGKAVCAGYADAYQRLLTAAGIRAYTLSGTADNGDGEPFPHAWTLLYLDGKCVYTDVTWDDPFINGEQSEDNISYTYFQLSYEQISRDHFPDASSKALIPASCNHAGYDYYSIMQGEGTGCGIFNTATSAKEAANYFRYLGKIYGKDQFLCDFRFEGAGMLDWIVRIWKDIASELGLTGSRNLSYRYSSSDAQMTISGTLSSNASVASVSVSPDALILNAAGMTAQLTATVNPSNATNKCVIYSSSDPSVATVSSTGLVTAISNGTAVITVKTNDGGKTATCKVTVSIPVPPEPAEPSPSEPAETTKPAFSTEPSVTTEPVETVLPVPTEPTVTTEPTDATAQTTQPAVPDNTTAATNPFETQTLPTAESEETTPVTQQPTVPSVPSVKEKESGTVLIVALVSGGVIAAASAILLLKRR